MDGRQAGNRLKRLVIRCPMHGYDLEVLQQRTLFLEVSLPFLPGAHLQFVVPPPLTNLGLHQLLESEGH